MCNSLRSVGKYISINWTKPIEMYSFNCTRPINPHGRVVNYPQGHGAKLICPLCLHEDMVAEARRRSEVEGRRGVGP